MDEITDGLQPTTSAVSKKTLLRLLLQMSPDQREALMWELLWPAIRYRPALAEEIWWCIEYQWKARSIFSETDAQLE